MIKISLQIFLGYLGHFAGSFGPESGDFSWSSVGKVLFLDFVEVRESR